MEKENPKKQPNRFLTLTSVGLEMGIIIYLSIKLGKWLDYKYPRNFELFTMIFTVLGVAISMYSLVKKLQKLNP